MVFFLLLLLIIIIIIFPTYIYIHTHIYIYIYTYLFGILGYIAITIQKIKHLRLFVRGQAIDHGSSGVLLSHLTAAHVGSRRGTGRESLRTR